MYDVYGPDDYHDGGYPLIVFVHGGAWFKGDRARTAHVCEHLSKNHVVVTLSYQLSTISPWPVLAVVVAAACALPRRNRLLLTIGLCILCLVMYMVYPYLGTNGAEHPGHIKDVASGVAHAVCHVPHRKGDVFLMGHSAGAHLVTLLASHPTYMVEAGLGHQSVPWSDRSQRCVQ